MFDSLHSTVSAVRRVLPCLGLVALLGSCAANPTGGTNFVLMTENRELAIGREEHEKLMATAPIYRDEDLQEYVNAVGQRLASLSDRPELDYTFTIIDSPDINAFALPGGYVYVNRGLITFLTSEAQLAAVLGHEIAHITARHAVRQQTAARGANILGTAVSVASIFATGTNVLGDTASLFGGALISGYGRDMELEADSLGAEYMARAGYDPAAILEVIGVLKNQEDFMKLTSNRGPTYHGLFATHPRNDTRLQQAVGKVGSIDTSKRVEIDPAVFREKTTGVVVGPSVQNLTGNDGRNRYYQNLLNYTLVFPQQWKHEETPTTVTARFAAADGSKTASLLVEVRQLRANKEPRLFMREDLGITDLQQSEPLSQFGLAGHMGIDPATGERKAVIYYNQRAFIFTGSSSGDSALDENIIESIRSFRPIQRGEQVYANPLQIVWIQADGRQTYAQLARLTRIPEHAEQVLRLMNGDWPSGEPRAGEWIKITN